MTATVPTNPPAASLAPRLRALRRDDGDLIDEIFDGMSPRSRYQRFHSPKPRLTRSDRARLTDVDDRDHLALVALGADGAPLGVARAVRLSEDPAAAELGIAVIDARQREGLGTELIRRLARRAAAVGIERLVANVLADSALVAGLRRRGWRLVGRDGPALTLAIEAWRLARA